MTINLNAPKFLLHWKPILMGISSVVIAAFQLYNHGGALLDTAKEPLFQLAVINGIYGLFVIKQRNVTGGDVGQPSSLPALLAANQEPATGVHAPAPVPPPPPPPPKV